MQIDPCKRHPICPDSFSTEAQHFNLHFANIAEWGPNDQQHIFSDACAADICIGGTISTNTIFRRAEMLWG